MPDPIEILSGLTTIANRMTILAVIWHVLVAAVLIGLLAGWRPSKRQGAFLSSFPLLSVSILAWIYGNPFNGLMFLIFGIALAVLGIRLPCRKIIPAPVWCRIVGLSLIAFGWFYPHFLAGGTWLKYLYAAPLGLIPCPTLSLVIGFALLANGYSSRAWSVTLAVLGLFYGVFGTFRLGVKIDLTLITGAAILLICALMIRNSPPSKVA